MRDLLWQSDDWKEYVEIQNDSKRQTVRWPIEIAPLSAARFLTFFRQRW